ncbi:MAG TPA: prephenate dehydrogenase/arogenate dehydrogenase family protein [Polyangiaceae bacterium]|nr:prephenate dehydrogenase/arogenate dehydrogenase family protein [Polyangiaceae bacterium]
MENDTVAVLGYGRFGRALGDLLLDAGVEHRGYDPVAVVPSPWRARSSLEAVRGARWVVLAVPVSRMREILLDLRPHLERDQIVLDVGSVKVRPATVLAEVLGDTIPWCPTHPLFGPVSLALAERPLRVVTCPAAAHPRAAALVRDLYERIGCEVIEQTPEGHDRVMAHTHALTFFVAKGMLDAGAGLEVPFAPPSFQAISRTIETVRSDAGHLFSSIARDNPFAPAARKQLIEALVAIDRALDAESARGAGATEATSPFVIPDLGDRSPELRQTRDLIDGVDRDLLRLLARRSELQHRAARAKAAMGAPLADPTREAEVVASRSAWARELKVDPDGAAEVFRAILTMSRRTQRP